MPARLFIGRPETERVPVRISDRYQKSNRTRAVERRNDGDGDLIPDVERIRSVGVTTEAESRDAGNAAADDRPLDHLSILVLDVDSQRRMGIDNPECLERPSHLGLRS